MPDSKLGIVPSFPRLAIYTSRKYGVTYQETYFQTRASSEDLYWPAHSRSLIRILPVRILDSQCFKVSSF